MYIFCTFCICARNNILSLYFLPLVFTRNILLLPLPRCAFLLLYFLYTRNLYILFFFWKPKLFVFVAELLFSLFLSLFTLRATRILLPRALTSIFPFSIFYLLFFSLAVRRTKYGSNSIIILFHHWMYAVYALWSLTLCLSHCALFVPFFGHSSSIAHAFCLHSIYNIHTMESWTLTPLPHSCDKFYFCALSLKTFAAQIYVRNAKIIRQVRHKRIMFSY